MSTVQLDFSKAQPIPQQPVTLDFSKAQPLLATEKSLTDKLTEIQPHQAVHSASDAVREVGRGVGNIGAGAMGVLLHPIDTAAGVANSILHPIDTATTLVKNLKEHPLETIESGIGQSTALGVAGEAAGAAAGPAGELAKRGAGKAVLLGKTPAEAYESALKPSTVLPQAQRAAIVQTGLENEIPVSKQGLKDIGTAIDNLNQAIKGKIAADPAKPIDPNAVATRADAAKAKFAQQVNAGGDLKAIDASKQQFLDENPTLTAADAQAMKQGTYRVLSGKFGEQGSASVEAQKALARGLKEEIATQFPEISKLNADESRLLNLQPILERAVNRISNHQAMGIGTPIATTAATAVTGSSPIGAVTGALKMVLDNPMVKSRLAIMVSKSAKIPISQATSRVQAYATKLGASAGAILPTSDDQTGDQK